MRCAGELSWCSLGRRKIVHTGFRLLETILSLKLWCSIIAGRIFFFLIFIHFILLLLSSMFFIEQIFHSPKDAILSRFEPKLVLKEPFLEFSFSYELGIGCFGPYFLLFSLFLLFFDSVEADAGHFNLKVFQFTFSFLAHSILV